MEILPQWYPFRFCIRSIAALNNPISVQTHAISVKPGNTKLNVRMLMTTFNLDALKTFLASE